MPKEKARKHNLSAVPDLAKDLPESEDLLDVSEVCKLCFGAGIQIVPGQGARPCECRMRDAQNRSIERARLPKRYFKCHFHNYKPTNPSQERAFGFAMRLAMEYPAVEQGLLLMGPVGVGKTHLAVSILKGLTERGISCLFYEFGSLLKEIQGSYNADTQSSELRVLAPVFTADVLVLDELGASKPTEWVRDTMSHIINTRYNDRRVTVFTTNYLDERRTDREETLEDRVGTRLRSRLFEMCKTVSIAGDDFRKTFDRNRPVKQA